MVRDAGFGVVIEALLFLLADNGFCLAAAPCVCKEGKEIWGGGVGALIFV